MEWKGTRLSALLFFFFIIVILGGKKKKGKGKSQGKKATISLNEFLADSPSSSPAVPFRTKSWADETDDLDVDGKLLVVACINVNYRKVDYFRGVNNSWINPKISTILIFDFCV